ncbi:MAG: DUF3616 domain-containing protein [Microcystaceae cyanobacterium]
MIKNPLLRRLLSISLALFLGWIFQTTHAKADNLERNTLGNYPVCEPSSVVKLSPTSSQDFLLVGDNEQKESVFLYPVSGTMLKTNKKVELPLGKEISDIEAIANLDDNKVLIFGSHSRNTKCEIKNKRRRFVQAKLSDNQLELIGKVVKYPEKDTQLKSTILFAGLKIQDNKILEAVSEAIDNAEKEANDAEGDKETCTKANSFNAEGAVTFANNSSTSRVWLGLRSPQVSMNQKDYAILLQLATLESYQFDGAALIDLEGLGIRELTFHNNQIWGIAGGPEDGMDNFVLWRIAANEVKPNAILTPTIVRNLPMSSEGLAIVDKTIYVLIDGDEGDIENQCEVNGEYVQFSLPN